MKTVKLGVVCEFGENCGLGNKALQAGTRICNGEHTISDYDPTKEYTSVIEVPNVKKGVYLQ